MAIKGTDASVYQYKSDMGMDVISYEKAVGDAQVRQGGNMERQSYPSRTDYVGFNGYVLSGRAGITANFYNAFANAFDEYKKQINSYLDELETNPNITRAFQGTDISDAVKNLIVAVKAEAQDYLFKLETVEKSVIQSVKAAFDKQQASMGSTMSADTSQLSQGNASQTDMSNFANRDSAWRGTQSNLS